MQTVKNQQRIEQIAGIALIGAIVVGCIFVLRPFATTILWAAIMCFATWPVHELLIKALRGRRTLAAGLMTIILTLMLLIPFILVGLTFTENITAAMQWLKAHQEGNLPKPPEWLKSIPLAGTLIYQSWLDFAVRAGSLVTKLGPYTEQAGAWLIKHSLDLAKGLFQLDLSIFIAFFLYRGGEGIVARMREGIEKISGKYASHLIDVAKNTVQSVVYGMLGTAIVQGIVAGIGFLIAGVPSPILLALFTFFLSIVPVGPPVIWIGASIWLFYHGSTGWGIFMLIYGFLAISSVDNLIRPYLISRGTKLPFVIMLIGVLGGVVTFGFIGIFIGPTLLAIGYGLTQEILKQNHRPVVPPVMPKKNETPTE